MDAKQRNLDDEQLGSDDDEEKLNRDDDMIHSGDEEAQERAQTILDVSIGRHAMPKPSDGEVYWLSTNPHLRLDFDQSFYIALSPPIPQLSRNRTKSIWSHKL